MNLNYIPDKYMSVYYANENILQLDSGDTCFNQSNVNINVIDFHCNLNEDCYDVDNSVSSQLNNSDNNNSNTQHSDTLNILSLNCCGVKKSYSILSLKL